MVFSQPCSQPPLFTLHSFISERKREDYNYNYRVHFSNTIKQVLTSVCFLVWHLSKLSTRVTLNLLCVASSTQCRLTSAVGQSIHGVAFVAETLKTTRGVQTRVITCPLKKTLIYICNQRRADDIIAEQSVAVFIRRDSPPTETHSRFIQNFPTRWNVTCTVCDIRLSNFGFWW